MPRFLSWKEVLHLIPLSRTHLGRKIKDKTFPEHKALGNGWRCKKGFVDIEVYAWMKDKGYPFPDETT